MTATLPTGINTGTTLNLKILLLNDRVMLNYDPADGSPPVFLVQTKNHIPPPYTTLLSGHGILNGTTPASTTTLNVDMVFLNNYNLLEVNETAKMSPASDAPVCTNVAAAVGDTVLLAANKNRKIATVFNDSSAILYLKFGSGASTTSFTVRLAAYSYYEVPVGMSAMINGTARPYNGQINGYWAAATGNARVTEVS